MTNNSVPANSVVITWSEGRSALCAIRSLGRKRVRTIAISSVPGAMGFYSRYSAERCLVPSYATDLLHYRDSLFSLSKRSDVLTIMPFTEADAYVLCTWRDAFEKHVQPMWVSKETFELVSDRMKLFSLAESLEIPTPKTRLMSEWDDWSSPCIIKSRYSIVQRENGLFYGGVRIVDPQKKPDYESTKRSMMHEPLVQEFVDGDEYGFFALFNEGRLRAKLQHRRLLSMSYSGGASVLRTTVYNEKLDELGLRILRALKWHGPAMVEFKFDREEREFKLMEINPRFWGSLNLGLCAGVDFPYLYYQVAKDGDCESILRYKTNVSSHYSLGIALHLLSVARARYPTYVRKPPLLEDIRFIISALLDSKSDVSDWRDLAPSFADLWSTFTLRRT